MAHSQQIHPVILAGGSGQRLWPLSRPMQPKPFLDLTGDQSLLQLTAARLADHQRFAEPLVICGHKHRFVVAEQLRQSARPPGTIVLEPAARNTAPAACTAALLVARRDPQGLMMLLASDHFIRDEPGFLKVVDNAAETAANGWIVTFGAQPDRPETGYGYIQQGPAIGGRQGSFRIERFVEKPDLATAEGYLADGRFSWNSGMFLSSASLILEEMGRFEPKILSACEKALEDAEADSDFLRLEEAAFADQPSTSIDYAVMERTDRGAVVPFDVGWSDAGTWEALHQIAEKDAQGNATRGKVLAVETKNSYLRSEGTPITALGLEDMVVVSTPDVILVCPRSQSQNIARVIDGVGADPRFQLLDKLPPPGGE